MPWTNRPSMPAGHRVTATDIDDILDQIESLSDQLVFGAVYKPADEQVTSTTTYQDDNDLEFQVEANGVYLVDCYLVYQSSVAGSLKIKLVPPSGTIEVGTYHYDPGTDEWNFTGANLELTGAASTGGNVPLRLQGTLFVGATGGPVTLQWTQNASNATATILRKGSRITYARLA